jgi:hypothetical protein
MLPRIQQSRVALILAIAGAFSFWLPDALIHIVAQNGFDVLEVWAITVISPITSLVAYVSLRRIAARLNYRQVGFSMTVGVWLLGAPTMEVSWALSGGFRGPGGVHDVITLLPLSFLPPITWMLSAYHGSMGALIIVSVGALVLLIVRIFGAYRIG